MSKTLRRRSTDKGRRTKGRRTKRKVTNKSKSRLRTKHRTRNNRLKKNNRLRGNHSFKTYNGGAGIVKDMGKLATDTAFSYREQTVPFYERYPHLHNKLETAKKVGNVVRHPMRERRRYEREREHQRRVQRRADLLGVTLEELRAMENFDRDLLDDLVISKHILLNQQDKLKSTQKNYNLAQTQNQGEGVLALINRDYVHAKRSLADYQSNYDRQLEYMRSGMVSTEIDEAAHDGQVRNPLLTDQSDF